MRCHQISGFSLSDGYPRLFLLLSVCVSLSVSVGSFDWRTSSKMGVRGSKQFQDPVEVHATMFQEGFCG